MTQKTPRVLVTGGAGFIGSHIARHWKERGADVVVLDNLSTGRRANIEGIPLIEGSILDRDLVTRAAAGCDYVFHMAALISVAKSMQNPTACVEVNVLGTLNVLEASRAARARKVVFASTAAVYGDEDAGGGPRHEDMPTHPISPYGVSKLDGELYLEMYRREHGLSTVSLRYFNVFGPRQSCYSAVIPIFIERALRGEDILIHGDGTNTRDMVYVGDAVAANVFAAETPDLVGVYNVGHGRATSVRELAETIVALVGSRSQISFRTPRAGDIAHSTADASRLRAAGFGCTTSLESGLSATIEWYRAQMPLRR